MIMKVILDILGQPLYLCLFILHKIQTTFPIVSDSFMGKRAIEAAAVGGLVGWVVLAIIVAAVIFVAMKYVLEDAFSGTGARRRFLAPGGHAGHIRGPVRSDLCFYQFHPFSLERNGLCAAREVTFKNYE